MEDIVTLHVSEDADLTPEEARGRTGAATASVFRRARLPGGAVMLSPPSNSMAATSEGASAQCSSTIRQAGASADPLVQRTLHPAVASTSEGAAHFCCSARPHAEVPPLVPPLDPSVFSIINNGDHKEMVSVLIQKMIESYHTQTLVWQALYEHYKK